MDGMGTHTDENGGDSLLRQMNEFEYRTPNVTVWVVVGAALVVQALAMIILAAQMHEAGVIDKEVGDVIAGVGVITTLLFVYISYSAARVYVADVFEKQFYATTGVGVFFVAIAAQLAYRADVSPLTEAIYATAAVVCVLILVDAAVAPALLTKLKERGVSDD